MGCCQSRPKGTESTDGSNGRGDAHASNEDGESVAPRDVAIGGAHVAVDSVLSLGGAVPVVGDFFDLIANFKDQCMELLERVDEAIEVETWAQNEVNLLKEIEKKLNRRADTGSNEPADKALRQAGIKLQRVYRRAKGRSKAHLGRRRQGQTTLSRHDPQKKFRVGERSRRGGKGGIQPGSRGQYERSGTPNKGNDGS